VDLYIHSPIRLHGVVLNELSTGTTLLFTFTTHLCLGLSNYFVASGFPAKTTSMYVFLIAHFIIRTLIILIISDEVYRLETN
jgi:hypothetical protein